MNKAIKIILIVILSVIALYLLLVVSMAAYCFYMALTA